MAVVISFHSSLTWKRSRVSVLYYIDVFGNPGQLFGSLGLFNNFSWHNSGYAFLLQKYRKDLLFSPVHCVWKDRMLHCYSFGDVIFDDLAKIKSGGFLHCNVSIFLFGVSCEKVLWEYANMWWFSNFLFHDFSIHLWFLLALVLNDGGQRVIF